MKKYLVFSEEYETVLDAVEAVLDALGEDEFDDFLYDEYGSSIDVCGVDFDPVELLRDCGSAYRDRKDEWLEEVESDLTATLEYMDGGDSEIVCNIRIECIEDEEDEEPETTPAAEPTPEHDELDEVIFNAKEAIFVQGEIAATVAAIPSVYVDKEKLNALLGELFGRVQGIEAIATYLKEQKRPSKWDFKDS